MRKQKKLQVAIATCSF